MNKTKLIRLFRKLHRWPGVVIAFFALMFATSGVVLNHRETFSSLDIPRWAMPPGYRYNNWNLAAVRGSQLLGKDSLLLFGNIGVWLTDSGFSSFSDWNNGFPKGIDKRKIYALRRLGNQLVAGTHFGLFVTGISKVQWEAVELPVKELRISDLALKNDTLLVLTRGHLLKTTDLLNFDTIVLPAPEGYVRKTGLFNTLWELHSGELFGLAGRLFVDLLGIAVIWLSVSGLLHFFFPGWIRRRKARRREAAGLLVARRVNLRWHNIIGYTAVAFLVVNTLAGMFLRPPLLIAIAQKQVGIIPFTHLDNQNPWHDKLRRIVWHEGLNRYLVSTSKGFFTADENFNRALKAVGQQPPVSVMGCNVLEFVAPHLLVVGSFSGMFLWDTQKNTVSDFFTGRPYMPVSGLARPIGEHMVAGWVADNTGAAWWFDYNQGASPVYNLKPFTAMPDSIVANAPISLWNAALEIHTGRIFAPLIGPFYILIVPVAGLCMVMVLISGLFVWWLAYRRKKPSNKQAAKM